MVFQQLLETWLHSEKEWERERALQVCTQLMKAYAERFVAAVSIASLLPEPLGSPVGAAGVSRGGNVRADLVSQEALQGRLCSSALASVPICHKHGIPPQSRLLPWQGDVLGAVSGLINSQEAKAGLLLIQEG